MCKKPKIKAITAEIRLPWYISGDFGKLDIYQSLSPWWENDDPIVDRQLKWIYDRPLWSLEPFTIYATQNGLNKDKSIVKESNINNINHLIFQGYSRNPFTYTPDDAKLTIISPSVTEGSSLTFPFDSKFKNIINNDNPKIKDLQLKFSLLNILQSVSSWMIYPFLEYKIDFDCESSVSYKIPDKYYKIESIWSFWDYQINNIIFKPTITESILRSFTTIL